MRSIPEALQAGFPLKESTLHTQITAFYGFTAEYIAQVCGVSVACARGWKNGKHSPPRVALRLFRLHAQERVLGDPWAGWIVRRDTIVDPEGNATTVAQLRGYSLILQFAREMARDRGEATLDAYKRLLG